MNGVRTNLLDKAMAVVKTLYGDRLYQQTWGAVGVKRAKGYSRSLFLLWRLRSLVPPRFGP